VAVRQRPTWPKQAVDLETAGLTLYGAHFRGYGNCRYIAASSMAPRVLRIPSDADQRSEVMAIAIPN
jgi:hypothetical protein